MREVTGTMVAELKAFLTGSNALAVAIGIIIGTALGAVVLTEIRDERRNS